jgi:hypothetical protein
MKKKILIVLALGIFICGTFNSYAGEPVTKGPIAGWHYSDILKDGKSLYGDYNNSFYVGFFTNKQLGPTKLLQINTALVYFQNGSKENDNNKIRLHYLNIPVSLRVQVGPIYALAGINGGIKLGGEKYILGVKSDVSEVNTWDAGWQLALGAKIGPIGVEAKYNWGLVDVYKGYKSEYLQLGILLYVGGRK